MGEVCHRSRGPLFGAEHHHDDDDDHGEVGDDDIDKYLENKSISFG